MNKLFTTDRTLIPYLSSSSHYITLNSLSNSDIEKVLDDYFYTKTLLYTDNGNISNVLVFQNKLGEIFVPANQDVYKDESFINYSFQFSKHIEAFGNYIPLAYHISKNGESVIIVSLVSSSDRYRILHFSFFSLRSLLVESRFIFVPKSYCYFISLYDEDTYGSMSEWEAKYAEKMPLQYSTNSKLTTKFRNKFLKVQRENPDNYIPVYINEVTSSAFIKQCNKLV